MGLYIIAAAASTAEWLWVIFLVAAGLGAVIFVHELGHFLVAKACGVRCDKFYIGFDINGWKIFSFQWGETEYGIGILPLGGYVKMLGQDDNPANAARERENTKIRKEFSASKGAEQVMNEPIDHGDRAEGDESESYETDPRSYIAKSVPQRMAIISAGVIMNIIFAFIFATWAYMMGVKYTPCIVQSVVPGSPAYVAGLQPGDSVEEIDGFKQPRFKDMQTRVVFGDMNNGVSFVIEQPGVEKPITVVLKPDQKRGVLSTVGITGPATTILHSEIPFSSGTPAARATPSFMPNDEVIAVDDKPVMTQRDFSHLMAGAIDREVVVTVRRGGTPIPNDPYRRTEGGEEVKIKLAPNPLKRLGLVMKVGVITAVQADSPAAKNGLLAGDFIEAIDGQPVGDPLTLSARLRKKAEAGESVELTLARSSKDGDSKPRITITPRKQQFIESYSPGSPLSIAELGVCVRIMNIVDSVLPESPAAKLGKIQSADSLSEVAFVVDKDVLKEIQQKANDPELSQEEQNLNYNIARRIKQFGSEGNSLKFDYEEGASEKEKGKHQNWAYLIDLCQGLPPGVKLKLTFTRNKEPYEVELEPQVLASSDSENAIVPYDPSRGLIFTGLYRTRTATSLADAMYWGGFETKESLLMVYRFLAKLANGQIPLTALGGPGTIAKAAGMSAFDGLPSFLIFLTLLSANLAVVNFLPIPVLDGGHFVFLTLEGIMRKPVSEKVLVTFQVIGFVFLVSLMIFVISLDLGIIPRNLN